MGSWVGGIRETEGTGGGTLIPGRLPPTGRSFTDFSVSTVFGIWTEITPLTTPVCDLNIGCICETGKVGGGGGGGGVGCWVLSTSWFSVS